MLVAAFAFPPVQNWCVRAFILLLSVHNLTSQDPMSRTLGRAYASTTIPSILDLTNPTTQSAALSALQPTAIQSAGAATVVPTPTPLIPAGVLSTKPKQQKISTPYNPHDAALPTQTVDSCTRVQTPIPSTSKQLMFPTKAPILSTHHTHLGSRFPMSNFPIDNPHYCCQI